MKLCEEHFLSEETVKATYNDLELFRSDIELATKEAKQMRLSVIRNETSSFVPTASDIALTFVGNKEIMNEIMRDVNRTRAELKFFSQTKDGATKHADVLAKMLFIYTKRYPDTGYVQGMNELLAVLYFCFQGLEPSPYVEARFIESDIYFAFESLMKAMQECYYWYNEKIESLKEILELVDPTLQEVLDMHKIEHHFYGIRWFRVLMSQEFNIEDTLRLWDCLLVADYQTKGPVGMKFIDFVAAAVIKQVSTTIKEQNDPATMMELLNKAASNAGTITEILGRALWICKKWTTESKNKRYWDLLIY